MNKMKRKLRSQTGASLTFALLLFLVCAVVGSVVLTAGTAAAGRMSKIAEMDQRYYSVTSAADFLIQELSDKKVTIVRTKKVTESTTTTYTVSVDEETGKTTTIEGDTTEPSVSDPEYTTTLNGKAIDSTTASNMSFLTERAFKHLFGGIENNTEAAWACSYKKGKGETKPEDFSMVLNITSGTALDSMKVIIYYYELKKDGTLILSLRDDTQGTNDHYSLKLTMKPKYREWSNTIPPESLPEEIQDLDENNQYIVKRSTTKTESKTSEISWTLSGISVIRAGES